MKCSFPSKRLFTLLLFACSATTAYTQTPVSTADSLALVALYNNTGGPDWTNKTNWLTGVVSTWYGVTVSGNRVTTLSLGNNGLSGPLPPDIGDLTQLIQMTLDSNAITGVLPVEFQNLTTLKTLDLSVNFLGGDVPLEFNNMDSLITVDLSDNNITGLPDLTGMVSLSSLNVENNKLTFEDLEPNIGISAFQFDPQQNYGSRQVFSISGEGLAFSAPVGGTSNAYQWYKDSVALTGATADSYSVASTTEADAGVYYLSVTNSITGLTLASAPIDVGWIRDFYWIGDGGSWNDLSHWSYTSGIVDSVDALPGIHDNVFFDANSFTLAGQAVVIPDDGTSVGVAWKNMDWRGVANFPTFQIKTTTSPWVTNTVTGSMYFDDNMIVDFQNAEFEMCGSANYEIDLRNHFLGPGCWLAFNYSSSGLPTSAVTADLLSDINYAIIFLYKGVLRTNGYDISGDPNQYFWAGNGGPSTADISNSQVDVGAFRLDAGSSIIDNANTELIINGDFTATGQSFNHVTFSRKNSMANAGSNSFDTLEILSMDSLFLKAGATQTVNTLIANGTELEPIFIGSTTPGTPAMLSKSSGVANINYGDIRDNTAVGGATFNAYYSVNSGNVTGWNFIYSNNSADSLALVDFYNSTKGTSWTNSTNWLTGPLGTWQGVTVEDGRVVMLNLFNNNVTGDIPESISALTALRRLALSANKLTGSISAISNLIALEEAALYGNKLTGSIPASITTLTELTFLDLTNNELTGYLPSGMGNLSKLERLYLANNRLSGPIPADFANLTNLTSLDLKNNEFTSLPALPLTAVEDGNISDNFFTFTSLIPNASISGLIIGSQKQFPVGDTIRVMEGDPFVLQFDAGGTGTKYQWSNLATYVPIDDSTSVYQVAAATPADAGSYAASATNPLLPGVTLSTSNWVVDVMALASTEEAGYTFQKKLGAEALGIFQYVPWTSAFGSDGTAFVFDKVANRVLKFDPSGSVALTIDQTPYLSIVSDMEIDASGDVYISDETKPNIVKFTGDGTFEYEIPGLGALGNVFGIAVSSDSVLLGVERLAGLVFRFDATSGTFIDQLSLTGGPTMSIYLDLEVDGAGNMYVLEPSVPRIDEFTSAGAFVKSFDLASGGVGQWASIQFTIDASGAAYVQAGDGTIYLFSNTGTFTGIFGAALNTRSLANGIKATPNGIYMADDALGLLQADASGNLVRAYGPLKNANGQFSNIKDIKIDSRGYRYVVDSGNGRIQKFNSSGDFVIAIGARGSGASDLDRPSAIAIDENDVLYVADLGNNRIQKYTSSGAYLGSIGAAGAGDGQFNRPSSLAISQNGFLYVLDAGNFRVQKFTTNGVFQMAFGSQGTLPGQFTGPNWISVENDGNIVVVENKKLIRFNEEGVFLSEILMGESFYAGLQTDNTGALYSSGERGRARKLNRTGGLITYIGEPGRNDGQLDGPTVVSTNTAGDTVWIASQYNRISIFYANYKNASSADSLILADLYNSTGGDAWFKKDNWLTSNVDTWFGISMSGGKIRSIQLADNNLQGSIPAGISLLDELDSLNLSGNKLSEAIPDLTGMYALQKLDLSDNLLTGPVPPLPVQLADLALDKNSLTTFNAAPEFLRTADLALNDLSQLPDLSGKSLRSLHVQENKLTFEDLEPNIDVPDFTYIPQDTAGVASDVVREVGGTVTFFANLGGTANVYQWYKNGVPVAGATADTLRLNSIALEDDAFYSVQTQNALVPGLTLSAYPTALRVSSRLRDSLALVQLFQHTNGGEWRSSAGWFTDNLPAWQGITVTNNRVTEINLPANNLAGKVPKDILDMLSLIQIDLSGNAISDIPDFNSLKHLAATDVSENRLDFGSLIANASLSGINYASQARIGVMLDTVVDVGSDFTVTVVSGGEGNMYTWKHNGVTLEGAHGPAYVISGINRDRMGEFVAEVTNPAVEGLTLTSHTQRVRASANMSGSLLIDGTSPATRGTVKLFRITKSAAYDTVASIPLNGDGTFTLQRVVLDDYQLMGFADTLTHAGALPTYYRSTILWEEADTLSLENNIDSLNIISQHEPVPPAGHGSISGYLQQDDGTGRLKEPEKNKRIAHAGVACRRVERTGRAKEVILTLVAYVFTNEQGEFTLPNLPPGEYRLNFQYPGYPMDETSYTTIMIGDSPFDSHVVVEANVVNEKIRVSKLVITGLSGGEPYRADVYPNPAIDHVRLKFAGELPGRMIMFVDMQGKVVRSIPAAPREVQFDLRDVRRGIYMLKITEKGVDVKTFRISIE